MVELLSMHPDWGLLQLNAVAAFQDCSRRAFLSRIRQLWPGAYWWVHSCHLRACPCFVLIKDGLVR